MTPPRPRPRGFTLVEAIAAISVIGIVGGISSSVIYSGVVACRDTAARAQIHEEVSTALEQIVMQLRGIPRSGPGPAIDAVTPSSIAWAGSGRLELSGGTVVLTPPGGTASVMLRNVSEFSIACSDADGAPLPADLSGDACQSIRRVRITVAQSREGVSERLRTAVYLRSMMGLSAP